MVSFLLLPTVFQICLIYCWTPQSSFGSDKLPGPQALHSPDYTSHLGPGSLVGDMELLGLAGDFATSFMCLLEDISDIEMGPSLINFLDFLTGCQL